MRRLTRSSYPSPPCGLEGGGAVGPAPITPLEGREVRAPACYFGSVQNPDLQTVFPFVEQLGFGAVAGFAAGFALKKVGKLVAIVLGLIFVAVQVLAYFGFVSINWGAVQGSVDPLLTPRALNGAWRTVLAVLTYNIAFAAAFVPSFVWGLKRG